MSVSVVIPTTLAKPNVTQAVEQVIAAAAKTGPDAEVIVVVNGLRAAERDLGIRSPHLRVVDLERASAPGARNEAIQRAWHETICFTDDDCLVPDDWCLTVEAALAAGSDAAVAGPVRLATHGPVTAFINHQRVFDAPPDDRGGLKYVVTANCAYRRDRMPGHLFDDQNFNHGAEDADFGYRLRDLGLCVRWLDTAAPVIHRLSESIEEITERFVRYGHANARLYWRKGRWQESVPDPLPWYDTLLLASSTDVRCFDEVDEPPVRLAFACYEQMQAAAFLIGYLDALGADLGEQLIRIDDQAIGDAWQTLDTFIRRQVVGTEVEFRAATLTFHLDREDYSKPHVFEKKNSPRAALYASR